MKPSLVYFRWPLIGAPNPIRLLQEQEIIDRLAPTFTVHVIEGDCDYTEILDQYQPDLSLFEVKAVASHRPIITGVRDNSSVPKALLIRSDAGCYTRHWVLRDVEDLGIDACFAVDTLYFHYFESLGDRLFYMPHSIDPKVFRDYGLPKSDVIAFYGHFLPSRPWRIEAAKLLRQSFPCTFYPHDTSRTTAGTTRMEHGEAYARKLNTARFVPVEGGFHNGLTRKFFEVPASRTVMAVPRFKALEEYGFVDMESCIVGEPAELRDKIDVFQNDEGRYRELVEAGMRVAHERHAHDKRTQLRDWMETFRSAPPGSVIRQVGLFDGFVAVPAKGEEISTSLKRSEIPIDHFLLRRAERAIEDRRLEDAETDLVTCMNLLYARYLMEPRFYLAMVRLLQGRASEALFFLVSIFVTRRASKGVQTLDPREAGLLIISYLCLGETDKARSVAEIHAQLSDPELSWASALVLDQPIADRPARPNTLTLFTLARLSSEESWRQFVFDAAVANNQPNLAQRVVTTLEPA